MVDFRKFQKNLNKKEVEKLEKEHQAQNNNYTPLPSGTYPVKVQKMEVGKSNWGTDQINIDFLITEEDHKGQHIFYNGTFDDHFAHGIGQTARLLSQMTDGDVDEGTMIYYLTQDVDDVKDFILDLYQTISGKLEYDLDYDVRTSNKINPNTNKPYINKFFSIDAVYDA